MRQTKFKGHYFTGLHSVYYAGRRLLSEKLRRAAALSSAAAGLGLRFFRTAQFAAAPLRRTAVALAPPSANSSPLKHTSAMLHIRDAACGERNDANAVAGLRAPRLRPAQF